MKKFYLILAIVICATALFACSSENTTPGTADYDFSDYFSDTEESSENGTVAEGKGDSEQEQEEVPEATSSTQTPSSTTAPATTTTAPPTTTTKSSGLSPDFKAAMDSYESFMNEYVEFMKKYQANPGDLKLLVDYATFMKKYADFTEDFEKWEDSEMNSAETAYYIDVQSRVSKKLLEVAN